MAKILVVDDNRQIRKGVAKFLERLGHSCSLAMNGREALDALTGSSFELVISDIKMPEMDGLELLSEISQRNDLPVIMLTGHGTVDSAVEAMKLGAADFLPKPVQFEELEVRVNRVLAGNELKEENQRLRAELDSEKGTRHLIGKSEPMIQLKEKLKLLSKDGQISVLLSGETGTGKELAARALHFGSPRSSAPFVAVNCAALQETLAESELFGHEEGAFTDARKRKRGYFEQADGGTLFLDEIDSLSLPIQSKVLRAIEDRMVRRVGAENDIELDIRFVSASSTDLEEAVEEERFRRDLFFRIAVARLSIPPLNKRPQDIQLLVTHFCELFEKDRERSIRVSESGLKFLMSQDWPGNVRELRNLIELCGVTSANGLIEVDDLQQNLHSPSIESDLPADLKSASKRVLEQFEREFIADSLQRNQYNVSKTALEIGLSRTALHQKIKTYKLNN